MAGGPALPADPWRLSVSPRVAGPAFQGRPEEIAFFYDRTQRLTADTEALLRDEGRLISATLSLRALVEALGQAST